MIPYCLILHVVVSTIALQVTLEKFEQLSGTENILAQMRVHKVNRTLAALYGNGTVKKNLDNNMMLLLTLDHSPLGNSQFQRYPMKIGPLGWCDFLSTFWHEYYPYMSQYVTNLWKPNECPTRPSQQMYNDLILEGSMLPPYLPTGLWRAEMTITFKGSTSAVFHLLAKVHKDGYL